MASAADKLKRTSKGGIPAVATVASPRTTGVTSLIVDTQQFWPTSTDSPLATGVSFSTYKVDTNNNKIAGSQTDWSAISDGVNTLSGMVRTGGATDTGNAVGDKVQMGPTADWAEGVIQGLGNQHNADGTHGAITTTGYNQASGSFVVPDGVISSKALHNPVNFKAYRNASWSTGGAFTTVPFDAVDWDTSGNFSTGTHLFTAPYNAFYTFVLKVAIDTTGATNGLFASLVVVRLAGGTENYYGPIVNTATSTTVIVLTVEDLKLLTGDTVKGTIFSPSGLTGDTGDTITSLSGRLTSYT